jgi:hypothetical protein
MIRSFQCGRACGDCFADNREGLVDGIDARAGHIHADEFEVALIDAFADGGAHPDGQASVG